jgi:hypothetical protein
MQDRGYLLSKRNILPDPHKESFDLMSSFWWFYLANLD